MGVAHDGARSPARVPVPSVPVPAPAPKSRARSLSALAKRRKKQQESDDLLNADIGPATDEQRQFERDALKQWAESQPKAKKKPVEKNGDRIRTRAEA